ncbi:dynamin family protein [Helicobacter mesocricetorum]|uniref:dynamin family protein n=1 Tax=Helicobacter mesocricetorum TaxID=87012 RepID=UPI000CF19DC8|nr:dynamin family protein [Helicobacter mesocricetorum]
MEELEEFFKEVYPLKNLYIIDSNLESSSDRVAILLSLDAKNFAIFWEVPVLLQIYKRYLKETISYKLILQVQFGLCLQLQQESVSKEFVETILAKFNILNQKGLIENKHFLKMQGFLQAILDNKSNAKEPKVKSSMEFQNFFDESLEILQNQAKKIVASDSTMEKEFEVLLQRAKNRHFSIGVSGVLSSGKSTLLNALLGKEILGSSTIPETASLTILKYGATSYAEVTFWNKREWELLQQTFDLEILNALKAIPKFTQSLQEHILQDSKNMRISLEELPVFTSANHKDKLCNLVKTITLFTPLEILKNNVEIVDTPGLDDPIVQREEITKNYIKKCDLLIHAMNASQSATQLDMDFILQTLETTNISRLLIVLTHADLLEQKELYAALEYTQESVKKQLLEVIDKEGFDLFMERLDFIYLSSYPALLSQIDPKKASELGYSLESSNFQAFKDYLNQTLLGQDSFQSKDIIYALTQGFIKIVKQYKTYLSLQKELLFATEDKMQKVLLEAKEEKRKALESYRLKEQNLQESKGQMQEYLKSLKIFLTQKLEEAQNILIQRLFDDIMYDYQKNKIPSNERLENILNQGLKDFLVDILRQYQQNLAKKILQIQNKMQILKDEQQLIKFHWNESVLIKTKKQILNPIITQLPQYNKNQPSLLLEMLHSVFKVGFESFIEDILTQSYSLQDELILRFDNTLKDVFDAMSKDIATKDEILNKSLSENKFTQEQKALKHKEFNTLEELLDESLEIFRALQIYATRSKGYA